MVPSKQTQVIVVFGTKGGVGKTSVAANLAVTLAQASSSKVVLVEGDIMAMGDLAKMLHLSPERALVDIAPVFDSGRMLTGAELKQVLTPHSSGIELLPLIRQPQQAGAVKAQWLKPVIHTLRSYASYVVIDAGRGFTDHMLAAFDEANLLLLVLAPDIIALSQVRWVIEGLERMLYPRSMLKVVLNRAKSRGGVSTEDVESAVPCEVIGAVPSDGPTMVLAINQGIPVVLASPQSKVAQAFQELAQQLINHPGWFIEHATDTRMLAERRTAEGQFVVPAGLGGSTAVADRASASVGSDPLALLKRRIHDGLVEKLDLKRLDMTTLGDAQKVRELREKTSAVIADLLTRESGGFLASREERERIVKEITDEALGLGPLEDLLADPTINDILVNRKDQIYVERRGKLELTDKKFLSDDQLRTVIERIVAPLGRRIDEASPMVDARLADGSRVNAIIPPLALKGPTISIRKFSRERYTDEDLIRFGTVTPDVVKFLRACVAARKNIIVSGGTGSGKTTFLNMVSSFIPNNERIITIEDAAELRLDQDHLVSLESRPSNIEGRGGITIRDLFRNALRMRPDRIVIGECRGGETLDMLQAMNTGHDGSLTTVHANSPRDVISRLDSMVLMSSIELPVRAIREQIVAAVDVIVHTARLSDGSRKVTAVSEIVALKEGMEVEFRDLFIFRQTGVDPQTGKVSGAIVPTGQEPGFLEDLKVRGLGISADIFKPPTDTLPVPATS